MNPRLIHYSKESLQAVRTVEQKPTAENKPLGLWVSVEGADDWPSWCAENNFATETLVCATEIVLREDAKILRLETCEQLDAFDAEWGANPFGLTLPRHKWNSIRWDQVAKKWSGIIIAPYQWDRRLDLHWYYAWDCASGCIWDAVAIEAWHSAAPMAANIVRDPAAPDTVVRDAGPGRKDGTG